MKFFLRILKWFFISLLAIIAFFLVYCLVPPEQKDVAPSKYAAYWTTNMTSAEIDAAAQQVLSEMSLEEKVGQLMGESSFPSLIKSFVRWQLFNMGRGVAYSGSNERLHIPPLAAADGPRGLNLNTATCFPVTMLRGATWDAPLEYRVGKAMGVESRAYGVNYNLGDCINLLRHPAWGRAQESYGEDCELLGDMGLNFAQGIQSENVMCCVKHFAANSVENTRNTIDVKMDERTMHEVYLPHFKKCVEGGVASVMSAYNKVNGDYCGHNEILLDSILRKQWGFKGFVSSDWIMGVYDAEQGANAGMDIEMPIGRFYSSLPELIKAGKVSEKTIDEMVLRVLRTKLWYITRPDHQTYPKELIASQEHRLLAREVAEKGIVLLKNEQQILPLFASKINKIAVIGPLADAENTGDHVSSYVKPPYIITPLEGIRQKLSKTAELFIDNGSDLQKAAETARKADVVVLVVGYNYNDEGENVSMNRKPTDKIEWGTGGDRSSLRLKLEEEALIKAVVAANPKTVVTVISGAAVVMEEWRDQVPAILMAFYPGMEGGNALANVLFGQVPPTGRLPFTIAKKESDYPYFNRFADTITYGYYHGYTLMDKKHIEPAYPFGFGLSYSEVVYSNIKVVRPVLSKTDTLQAQVTIKNTGTYHTEEVVQLYVGFEHSAVDRPVKLLRSFQKIPLAPGQETTVSLKVLAKDLGWYNPALKRWEVETMPYTVYMGKSARESDLLKATFDVK